MKQIEFSTGRNYGTDQVLVITIEAETMDEFGLRTIVATFDDAARHIKGRVSTIVFSDSDIGPAVLADYDKCDYVSI